MVGLIEKLFFYFLLNKIILDGLTLFYSDKTEFNYQFYLDLIEIHKRFYK